jgi:hypothetical protein
VFGVVARARVLAATALGLLLRLATGFGEAIVTAFDPRTRDNTVKALAVYSRPQTKIPEVTVVVPLSSRDGNEEMYSRGKARSSEGAKTAGEAKRRVTELEKQIEQLRVRMQRDEKKARVATGNVAASEANAAAVAAESSALFLGNWRDPRLTFQGCVLVAERQSPKRSRAGAAAGRGGRAGSGAGSALGEKK